MICALQIALDCHLLRYITRFALMPDCKDKDDVLLQFITVQRKVARPATRNDELSQVLLCGATNQGMVFEDLHGFGDEFHRFQGSSGFSLQEKIGKPIKVSERSRGVDYPRQDLALGFGADLPCARARR